MREIRYAPTGVGGTGAGVKVLYLFFLFLNYFVRVIGLLRLNCYLWPILNMKSMKTIIFQTDICWADPEANRMHVGGMMDACPGADLYVLPEMFSTGFCTQPEGVAETGCETLEWMKRRAAEHDCAVAGSVATEEDGKYYNRFYFVTPDGQTRWYDKKHLFTYGGEHRHYTAGTERVVVSFRGVRFLLQVCYDLRFPVWSRNRKDYDAILYVASWPTPRVEAWKALLRARAIENQCYVIAVNRVGKDPYCGYSGGSAVIDPYGHTLAACEDGKEMCAVAEIDMAGLEAFRKKFPVLDDADGFSLI